eukprot:NODE_6964_length_1621_cov_6.056894.p1 GENE.NODE_6964_length_1621_cov_6.056894~~NODE_6964_length_1621_cov_6.056894.p1  ORF type:complete len:425 (-),score=77.76 NODE_6964_length_1621_cov_6.056894:169-1443(-)
MDCASRGASGASLAMPASPPLPRALSISAATATLTQNIVGAAIMALPYAMMCAGVAGGLGILALVLLMSIFSMGALVKLTNHFGDSSYKGLAMRTLGNGGATALAIWVVLFALGVCVGQVVMIGGTAEPLAALAGFHGLTSGKIMIVIMLFVGFPLACSPTLGFLGGLSFFGVVAAFAALFAVTVRACDGSYHTEALDSLALFKPNTIGDSFPIIAVIFGAHFNVPQLYSEVAPEAGAPGFGATDAGKLAFRRMFCVISAACTISAFICGWIGMAVYITFGDETQSNFSLNFREDDGWLIFVRVMATFLTIGCFPLTMVAARNTTCELFGLPNAMRARIMMSTILCAGVLSVAVLGGTFGTVLDYNGSLFGTPVCYIAPALMYLRLPRCAQERSWRMLCVTFGVLGALFAVLGTFIVTRQQLQG